MPEATNLFMAKEVAYLAAVRERVGKPPPEEVQVYLHTAFTPAMDEAAVAMKNPKNVRLRLDDFKADMLQETSQEPSLPDLCATYITTNIFEPYKTAAFESLQRNDIPSFRFFYDFAMGIAEVTSRIYEAEEQRNGRTQELFHVSRDSIEQVIDARYLDTRADAYVLVEERARTAAQVLEEHEDGFASIDEVLEELESGKPLESLAQSKDYVLAGARYATFLYKHSLRIMEGRPLSD